MTDFTVLVLPGAYASSVAVTLDMLQAAATVAPFLSAPRPRWRIASPLPGPVPLSSGLQLAARALPARAERSTWIIPGLGVDQPQALEQRLQQDDARATGDALRRHVAHGGSVAASCSAVFLLHHAGLLAGRRATTSWWLAGSLRQQAPECEVAAEQMVCVDGPLCTAGAALAQSDMMLHLLRSRFGTALAERVARLLLLDAREAQSPFVVPSMLAQGNELIRQLTRRIDASLPQLPDVGTLAAEQAMSSRTLSRHVRAATGQGVLALIQSVRLNRARRLLESSRLSIEQIAAQVGYADATALRRLMRKATGVTPSRFRGGGGGEGRTSDV
ncbi:AraC family transcriptional regulator [Alcanivorax sp. S71-1-4]|uniref:GlxA family transcriptional regulator n=1 Tax=Alcanivorax sp. S71-1-4 TaxID=1177159 RepID=UPI00135C89BD|nr:helix-turn-helix domain-containing protein [Alcanivorax sp. S71-1-4]KAF0808798.1 AraC family transcriptional regulator [Alcanivorax sp. S71-1-4]